MKSPKISRVSVLLLAQDGRAGEADDGRVGQRLAQVAVQRARVRAVRLVHQHEDLLRLVEHRELLEVDALLEGDLFLDHRLVLPRLLLLAHDGHGDLVRRRSADCSAVLILLQHREDDVRRRLAQDALGAGRGRFARRGLVGGAHRFAGQLGRLAELPSRSVRSVTTTILKRFSRGVIRILRTRKTMLRLLPEPWVCQMMPPRSSRSAPWLASACPADGRPPCGRRGTAGSAPRPCASCRPPAGTR